MVIKYVAGNRVEKIEIFIEFADTSAKHTKPANTLVVETNTTNSLGAQAIAVAMVETKSPGFACVCVKNIQTTIRAQP